MTAAASKTQGVHHLGLTVPQLAAARDFFVEGLGFEPVGEVSEHPPAFLQTARS